ncbi:GGDEF domain-containing protein [Bowmanella denitrificans]|uniref:diguanylate cyclase n=1 Tax=Bowmanella denitrificans TaxID=366582 RepID=A0ABN0XJG8_9ALTE
MDNESQTNTVRLDLSSQNQQKVLRSFKHQIDTLSQFILRLSKFYDGVNPLLDKELQVLRGHLGGKVNFTLAEVSIGKLTGLLMDNADHSRQQNAKFQALLEDAIQQLRETPDVPQALKEDSQQFLQTIRQSYASIYTGQAYLEKVLSLYQRALAESPATQGNKITKPSSDQDEQRLHQQLVCELRELVLQLSGASKDEELQEIRQRLDHGLQRSELLECCLVIVRCLLKDVLKDRKQAERFITSLHSTLNNVSQAVGRSLKDSQAAYQIKVQSNQQLRQHLQGIELAVGEAHDLSLLKQQACDYLSKIASTLDSRERADKEEQLVLMNLLRDMKDQLTLLEKEASEYKQKLLQQKYHSHHDPLTQIPNRYAYNDRVELEYRRWRRYGTDLSLALVDVDHFKGINDKYGHAGGDKTLQVIAQQIAKCLRSTDFLARWGGEEFVILFPQTPIAELDSVLEKIRQQIEKIPFKFKEQAVSITVSLGAAGFSREDDVDTVFERADRALYEAKHQGRNRCIISKG